MRPSCCSGAGIDLLEGRQTGLAYDTSSLAAVNFNTTIAGIETADAILLVGTNPRWEAPLVNTRIRKAIKRGAKVFAIGPEVDLTYKVEWLGDDSRLLGKLPEERPPKRLVKADRPAVIVGGGALKGAAPSCGPGAGSKRSAWRDGWNGFNVLHIAAARMGGLMLGFAPEGGIGAIAQGRRRLLFLLGADEADLAPFAGSFKVYVGHHGDKGAHAADVILPGAAYTEKPGTYVNLEGRVQRGERAVFPPGDAREDWTILRALSDALGKTLPFDSLDQLRAAMSPPSASRRGRAWPSFGWAPPSWPRRRVSGAIGLSDQGFLPHQPDRPRQPDDAALLGRAAPRRRLRGGGGMTGLRPG